MRRFRTPSALAAASVLTLSGCSDDAPHPPAPDDAAASTATQDAAPRTGEDEAAGEDEVEGGAEGQAAADRAKEFLLALVAADEGACDLLVSFSDPELPMTAVGSDLELCRTQLPVTMAATVEAQGLDEDGVAALEEMEITGADVQGDTAVVDRDNYSPLFADAMGDSTITLRSIDGRWYVDPDAYLQAP